MNFLSNEVLLEIFDRLDDNSIVAASQVCQRWSQLITESPSIMKRFTLSIISKCQYFDVCGKIVDGNYQNIILKSSLMHNSKLLKYLKKHTTTVKNVTMMNFMLSHLISTINAFELENLTKLTIVECDCTIDKTTVIEMPNLTHLELINSTEFLKFISIHNVKVLKILSRANHRKSLKPINAELLNYFLKTCGNFKELTLSKFNNEFTPLDFNINELTFNLVSLTVEDSIINNLRQFLLSQKDSLRNLAIQTETQDVELLKAIFYDLNLKELEINVDNVPQYFPSIIRNSSIKKLILRKNPTSGTNSNPPARFGERRRPRGRAAARRLQPLGLFHPHVPVQVAHEDVNLRELQEANNASNQLNPFQKAEKIISICSAVEEISIHDFDLTQDDFLIPIHTSMPNIKILKLSTVPSVISPIIQFDNLTHLEIDKIDHEHHIHNLILLIVYSPNLKVIKINKITTDLNLNFFTTIINKAKNLIEFFIGSNFLFTSEMCDAVRRVKNLGQPLRKLMFTRTSHVQPDIHDWRNIKMQSFKFLWCDQPQLFFAPLISEFKLCGMERDAVKRVTMLNDSKQYVLHEF